jgi:hypothetical protein
MCLITIQDILNRKTIMHIYLILYFFLSTLTACEFIAGVTVPPKYAYVDELFVVAGKAYAQNPMVLNQLERMEEEFLVLLATRNDTKTGCDTEIKRLAEALTQLISDTTQ